MGKKVPAQTVFKEGDWDLEVFSHKGVPRDRGKCVGLVAESCCPPGSSVQRIPQAGILEWVAIPFSRGSSWPGDWTWVSCIAGRFFTSWVTLEHIQGQKTRCRNFMVWKCWNRTESVLLSLWNYVRNQYQKISKNNPHIFKRNVTFTKRHLLWLSHWKNRGWLQHLNEKLISKIL